MGSRRIFHLSIPVRDLSAAQRFYTEVLGASIGRACDDWLDVLLWGHQITLQRQPAQGTPAHAHLSWHFGVVLPWKEWEALELQLRNAGTPFLRPPEVALRGTPQEQAKMYLADPSGNAIEIKAYRQVSFSLGYERE